MLVRRSRWALLGSLVGFPLVVFSCGEDKERKFVESSAGTAGQAGNDASAGSSGSGGNTDAGPDSADSGTPCDEPSDCNDGDACNGTETCTAGFCRAGTALANGTACTPVVGGNGDAGDAGDAGQTFVCAKGSCSATCTSDAECEDNDVCTGNEICSPETHTCTSGTRLNCNDNDACTQNECDPITGCFYPLIDADKDGHAAETLGTCGDDCNDNDNTIYTGAAELCDSKDNDCDDQQDELAPTWYADCDKDGFAIAAAESEPGCNPPATAPDACPTGGWTSRVPEPGARDCADNEPKAHPFTEAENNSAWQTTHIAGKSTAVDDDWNCDEQEEQRHTTIVTNYKCEVLGLAGAGGFAGFGGFTVGAIEPLSTGSGGMGGVPSAERLAAAQTGGGGIIVRPVFCTGTNGWTGAAPAACGTSASWSTCAYSSVAKDCVRTPSSKPQECR